MATDDGQSRGERKRGGQWKNRSAFIGHANGGSLTFSNRRCLFNIDRAKRIRGSRLSSRARFLSLLLLQRKGKIRVRRAGGWGRIRREREREREKEVGTRKCRPVITSLRVIYSGREGNGINHARWR